MSEVIEVKREGMELKEGVFSLNSMEDQKKYADYLISQKLVSETFKTASQLILSIQVCKDLGLPMSCLKDFYVLNGKPAIYGDTFIALALGSGVIEEHGIEFFDEGAQLIKRPKKGEIIFGCAVKIRRKGYKDFVEAFYTMDDREKSKNNSPTWSKHPTDMLLRRAFGRAIKWTCADAIRGIELVDYAEEAGSKLDEQEKTKQMLETFSS